MKAILLAAGQGSRLRPLTDNIPKCMVSYREKPLIDHLLETFASCDVEDITVVGGYRADVLREHLSPHIKVVTNERFATTNMVESLFVAEHEMDDDIIVSYTDIVYDKSVLEACLRSSSACSVVVDRAFRTLWDLRQDTEIESMEIDQKGHIRALGQPVEDAEAQYIGLMKFDSKILPTLKEMYRSMPETKQMYMTAFIQAMIDRGIPVKAVEIAGGWLEVDTPEDLLAYEAAACVT